MGRAPSLRERRRLRNLKQYASDGPIYREVIYIAAVYLVYSTVRNHFGSAGGAPGHANGIAYGHALDVIDLERNLRLFFEQRLQSWYLDLPGHGFIQFWNIFYGTAHFVVTAGALVWLFFRDPTRYPRWRNTLAFTHAARARSASPRSR